MQAPTLIEPALQSALDALISHRSQRREPAQIKPADLFRFGNAIAEKDIPTRAESWLRKLARDPIAASLENTIRRLGEQLYENGGEDRMLASLENISVSNGTYIAICNSKWDGIGAWHA